jgi:tetratricopeptide (TPR) repeat protein
MSYLDKLQEFSEKRGTRWDSGLIGFAAFAVPGVFCFFLTWSLAGSSGLGTAAAVAVVAGLAALSFWKFSCNPPKTPKGMIGIAFAISTENDMERRRLKADLLEAITTQLEHKPSALPFKVIAVPSYLAPDVADRASADVMRRKCGASLLIWGAVRTRKRSGREHLVVRLEGQVSHRQTAVDRSRALGQEMRIAIPERTEIDLENELTGLEATSQNLADAAKFIVALAAAVSDDWTTSKTLLLELYAERTPGRKVATKGKGKADDGLGKLVNSLPKHLSAVCYQDYASRMDQWDADRTDTSRLVAAEAALEDHHKYVNIAGKEGPPYWISKANLEVSLRGNLPEAARLLGRCKAVAIHDATWRLSLAFVLVLQGELDRAVEQYDTAFALSPDPRTVVQIEAYVQWWFATRQGPIGLLLLSALLNAKVKEDKQLALEDLDRFVAASPTRLSPKVEAKVNDLRAL